MECSECTAESVAFDVPSEFEAYLPGAEPGVALCPRCLHLDPVGEPPEGPPSFERLSDAFPTDPDAGVPMALLVGLLPNLALYRSEISALLERVEREGTDPLLVLDRLAREPDVRPDLDLSGRRRQLEQLL
jgi:hypothetical protein